MSTLFQRAGVPARRAQPTPTVGLEPPFGGPVSAPKLSDPCPDGQALMQRRRSVRLRLTISLTGCTLRGPRERTSGRTAQRRGQGQFANYPGLKCRHRTDVSGTVRAVGLYCDNMDVRTLRNPIANYPFTLPR